MKPDGSELIRLTNTEEDEFNPAWSPDNSEIIYQINDGTQTDLFVMALNSGRGTTALWYCPAD